MAAGILADMVAGEPPVAVHPVRLFGKVMRAAEALLYEDRKAAGMIYAGAGLALGSSAGLAVGSTAVATEIAVAGRSLRAAGSEIAEALERDELDRARALLPALAGRDPDGLDDKEIARAVVESVAENTVDAVVAPALWAAVADAPGAWAYRAANTLDAMVGHRNARYQRFGWASARADDVAGWIPARATVGLVMAVRPQRATAILDIVRRDGRRHPSPNAGMAEAAFAAAMGLRLGGINRYAGRTELRPALGDGRPAEPGDIRAAIRLSRDVALALAAALATIWLSARRR